MKPTTPKLIMDYAVAHPTPENVRAAVLVVVNITMHYARNQAERKQISEVFYDIENYCKLRILFGLYWEAGFYETAIKPHD